MNRIGFSIGEKLEQEAIEYGSAESIESTSIWKDLGEHIVTSLPSFAMIYGLFACIRDIVRLMY
jgi:hypothetical protein